MSDLLALERIPPRSLEAEMATLGAMLTEREAIARVVDLLEADDFYNPQHQSLYRAMVDLFSDSEPVDLVTLQARLQDRGQLEQTGGTPYLLALQDAAPTAAAVGHYARIVREKATLRGLIRAAGEIRNMAQTAGDEDVDTILDRCEQEIAKVGQRGADLDAAVKTAGEVMASESVVSWLADRIIPRGRLAFLAGPDGAGKSFVGMALCQSCASGLPWLGHFAMGEPGPAIYIDCEMGEEIVNERLHALGFGDAAKAGVHFIFDPDFRLGSEFTRAMRPFVRSIKPALIVVDCLGLMLPDGADGNSNADMRQVFRPIK